MTFKITLSSTYKDNLTSSSTTALSTVSRTWVHLLHFRPWQKNPFCIFLNMHSDSWTNNGNRPHSIFGYPYQIHCSINQYTFYVVLTWIISCLSSMFHFNFYLIYHILLFSILILPLCNTSHSFFSYHYPLYAFAGLINSVSLLPDHYRVIIQQYEELHCGCASTDIKVILSAALPF